MKVIAQHRPGTNSNALLVEISPGVGIQVFQGSVLGPLPTAEMFRTGNWGAISVSADRERDALVMAEDRLNDIIHEPNQYSNDVDIDPELMDFARDELATSRL